MVSGSSRIVTPRPQVMPRARAVVPFPGAFPDVIGAVYLRAVLEVAAWATRSLESHPDAPACGCVPKVGLAHLRMCTSGSGIVCFDGVIVRGERQAGGLWWNLCRYPAAAGIVCNLCGVGVRSDDRELVMLCDGGSWTRQAWDRKRLLKVPAAYKVRF